MKIINFSAGPSVLPRPVLEKIQSEFLSFGGDEVSVVEISHRSAPYEEIHFGALKLLRELLEVPETHDVLMLQGGTRQHFSQVPMNFLDEGQHADYLISGHWARQAFEEATIIADVQVAADSAGVDGRHYSVPKAEQITLSEGARYVHLCSNNTVAGTQWHELPDTGGVPMVIDMTSDILSRKIDWTNVGLAYAGAQKNLGPSGVVVIVVRKDMLEGTVERIPNAFAYKTHASRQSLYYTPSNFSVYAMYLVLEHAKKLGGIPVLAEAAKAKSQMVYEALSHHPEVYTIPCHEDSRSQMNAVWHMPTDDATLRFLDKADQRGMRGLKGHRSLGGLRASLYNWLPMSDAEELVTLIEEFATAHKMGTRSGEIRIKKPRQPLLLKVDYDHPSGFITNYLKNLSDGGLLLGTELPVGELVQLRVSFPQMGEPIDLQAVVRWSEPESDEGEGESGLEFVDLSDASRQWLQELLEGGGLDEAGQEARIALVETNEFLRDVYAQEVKNWAELQQVALELLVLEESDGLFDALKVKPTNLSIVDLDGLNVPASEMVGKIRDECSNCPIIVLGGAKDIEDLQEDQDEGLLALRKPIDFGQLMSTVRMILAAGA